MPNQTYARTQGRNRFGGRRRGNLVTKGYLRAVIGPMETKWYNSFNATPNVQVPSAGTIFNLNFPINTGNTQNTRIGNQITNRTLHMRLDIARAASVDSLCRVIIFWWLDGSGQVTPTPSQILEDATIAPYRSPLNKEFGKSFWVKFDRLYTLAAGQTQLQTDEIWRKLKCTTEFNDDPTSSNPTGVTQNSLHMLVVSNQATAANQPLFNYTSRLTFTDA